MATTAKGMYHPYAHARGATVGSIQIANGGTLVSDPGGIVSSVATGGAGISVVTLKRNYSRVHCVSETNQLLLDSKVTAVVAGGTSTNTITVTVTDKAGAANAGVATVTLAFYGYDS